MLTVKVLTFVALSSLVLGKKPDDCTKSKTSKTKKSSTSSCAQTICVDYINDCGLKYGGCYANCPGLPKPTFTPPPCTTTTTTSTSSCTQTICVDYINDCGQLYGGCYPNCPGLPTPTFTPPPCTTTTTGGPVTPTTTSTNAFCFICEDRINSCGRWYGGCYDSCLTPSPTFTDPGCSTTTTTPVVTPGPITTTSINTCFKCEDYVNSCGQTYGGCYDNCATPTTTFTDPGCPTTTTAPTTLTSSTSPCGLICKDFINSCGQTYGGCYDVCTTSTPSFTDPGCPTTVSATTTTSPTSTFCGSICKDFINSCGRTYGGCYDACATSTPSFTDPGCPTTVSATTTAAATY